MNIDTDAPVSITTIIRGAAIQDIADSVVWKSRGEAPYSDKTQRLVEETEDEI